MNPQNPAFSAFAVAPEQLQKTTVGRDHGIIVERIAGRIHQAITTGARPHTLVIGPYGSGKSHTLQLALEQAAKSLPETAKEMQAVRLGNDNSAPGSYANLLLEITRFSESSLYHHCLIPGPPGDISRLEASVSQISKKSGVFILLLEDIDSLFHNIGAEGQAALRGFVETDRSILILGSAAALFEEVTDREHAWYGSFDVERIPELTLEESQELLMKTTKNKEVRARLTEQSFIKELEVLHKIIGGIPRYWNILSKAVDVDTLKSPKACLEALLDGLAPHYQSRLMSLAPSERRLVIDLARTPPSATVSSLAFGNLMLPSAAASSLGRLARAGWVASTKSPHGDRRESWYYLKDPLLMLYIWWQTGSLRDAEHLARMMAKVPEDRPQAEKWIEITRQIAGFQNES